MFRSVLLGVSVLLIVLGGPAVGQQPRPNVLLICVDDLKPVLGCYGDPLAKTPHLDRLAAAGVRFDRAYCNQAVCSPSRNALLAGLRPQTLGIYDLGTNFRKAAPEAVTLPQYFRSHGYQTEALGKLFHVGHGNQEDAASWSVQPWKPKVSGYVLEESKPKEVLTAAQAKAAKLDPSKRPRGTPTEAADVADREYPDGAIAEEAVRRLQAASEKPGEPFFLAVGFLKPHLPFCAPQKYWDLYRREELPLPAVTTPPADAPAFAPTGWGELRQYRGMPKSGPLTEDQTRLLIHGYYAAVSYMDAQLGKVLDALERTGMRDNTIIAVWGDHGWHLGDHGMWCKHTNYEQAARIPLLVTLPGSQSKGQATQALVETVDIYPTLCEIAGLPPPAGLDGSSFANVLRDPAAAARESVIHVYPRNQLVGRAIRTDRYRMVEWKKPGDDPASAEMELYDYEADPQETRNLAASQPQVVAQLRAILARHPEAKPQWKPASATAKSSGSGKKKATDRNALFDRKDRNRDGKLTREEFLKGQPDPDEAPRRFVAFDKNQDGELSRAEFVER